MNEHKHPNDPDLIVAAQNGDFEAFRTIVLRYSNALLSVAYSVDGDFHEAQDITQEAFVKCYHHLHTLQDPSRLGSWLYSIAYRTSLDFAKKKKSTLPINESIAPKSDDIASWLDHHMLHESIWNALSVLEDKSKTAIVLHYLSEWSMKKIGLFLDLSVSAVESRIRRAREVLRVNLAGDYEQYFQSYRLDSHFEQKVSKQVLNRMGHFYIPVVNREDTRLWFVAYFHLNLSTHGNLLLESGEELYLLECQDHIPTPIPLLTFSVTDIDLLWLSLKSKGAHVETLETNELFGKLFPFYDPDGNKYYAAEKKLIS